MSVGANPTRSSVFTSSVLKMTSFLIPVRDDANAGIEYKFKHHKIKGYLSSTSLIVILHVLIHIISLLENVIYPE